MTAPTLRDIYQYLYAGNNVGANGVGGDQQGSGTNAPGLTWFQDSSSTEGGQSGSGFQFNPAAQFADGVRFVEGSPGGGAQSGGNRFDVDASKFPTTRFGEVSRTAPVDASTQLIDPRLVYDDPNYGRITAQANLKPNAGDRFNNAFNGLALSGAMAGVGYLGMPSIAGQVMGLARGLGSGQGLNFGTLAGMAGGAFGLPSWATNIGRLALSQALRNRSQGRS